MRRLTLAVPILALLALPAGAGNTIELVEMKNGRLYEAQELKVKGDRLWIRLAEKRPGEKVAFLPQPHDGAHHGLQAVPVGQQEVATPGWLAPDH